VALPSAQTPCLTRLGHPIVSASLDLQVTNTGGYTMVEVGGEIDLHTAPELRDCLNQAIDAGSRQLVVDLRQASFIDSVALSVLMTPGTCSPAPATTVQSNWSAPKGWSCGCCASPAWKACSPCTPP